jgi:outer membrane protein
MRSSPVFALRVLSVALACAFVPVLAAQDAPEAAPASATPAAQPAAGPQTLSAPVNIAGEKIIPITIEDAVQLALANNIGLRIETINRDTAREAVIVAEATFEPVFAASATTARSQTPAPVETIQATSSDRLTGVASVSQRVDTGASVTLQTNLGRSEIQGGTSLTPRSYGSDVSLSIRQPLLAGAGFKVNRAARERARIGVERSETTYRGTALDIVRDTELAFYNLASAHYALDVQRSGLATAQKFLDENEARRSAGLATELDVMQASVSVANRRAQIVSAEQRVRDATDQLLTLFGRRDFSGILQPVGFVFAPPENTTVERSYGRAVDNDPSIKNARDLLRQLEIDLLSARNSKLPTLDLQGNITFSGSDRPEAGEPNPDLGGALEDVTRGDTYNWQLGVNLNLPWGMNAARSRLRSAQAGLTQQQIRLEQLEQTTMVNIRSAVRAIESDKQTVEINALSAELSRREFELEKAKFDNGLSTSRLVVEAQQRWDEAKVRETQSRVQLRQNAARLRRLEGASLELYGVDSLKR